MIPGVTMADIFRIIHTFKEGVFMIYVTGDTHGDFHRFSTSSFPQQKQMGHSDYVIITGDFGGVWADTPEEKYWLDWLEKKPFTTLFVDGNHENFDRLNGFPVQQWHGGNVHFVRPHVVHLMRGQVFEIEGKTFFTMGGAASHDIQDGILDPAEPDFEQKYWFKRRTRQFFRVKGVSWWPGELPSDEEYKEAAVNLERVNLKVDYILTHCAPTSIQKKLDRNYTPDRLTDFLQIVKSRCEFKSWFFGHYHRDCQVDDCFTVQWEQITELL